MIDDMALALTKSHSFAGARQKSNFLRIVASQLGKVFLVGGE